VGGRCYRGNAIDDPLSENGWRQMWAAVENRQPWHQLITSPLRRCREFSEQLADRECLPMAIDIRFQEVGFGAWEGLSHEEVRRDRPAEYGAFYRDPVHCRPAGAEALEAFSERVVQAYHNCLNVYRGRHVLVVTHAGVIRALVAHILEAPLESMYCVTVDYAKITRIAETDRGAALVCHNSATW